MSLTDAERARLYVPTDVTDDGVIEAEDRVIASHPILHTTRAKIEEFRTANSETYDVTRISDRDQSFQVAKGPQGQLRNSPTFVNFMQIAGKPEYFTMDDPHGLTGFYYGDFLFILNSLNVPVTGGRRRKRTVKRTKRRSTRRRH